ncbi:MAG: hypothetical protein Ct9H300mP1_27360 [Planctomycetaceae bacterium]|nr:MAG: hypothetical protein Ct9H300mP1_27360 [Planctomycetaceae bacterium]
MERRSNRACRERHGVLGRVAVFELIEVNEEIRQLIAPGADAGQLKPQGPREEMMTLQKDAMRHVADGPTSLKGTATGVQELIFRPFLR